MGGVLCFVPDRNSPGKHDATGAFWPMAQAFVRETKADPAAIQRFPASEPLGARRMFCATALRGFGAPIGTLAFFCHGYKTGLQAGYQLSTVLSLGRLIAQYCEPDAYVLLYACDTGRDDDADTADERAAGPGGDGGFADELRDICEGLGRRITVMGHSTRGHCVENPYARRFRPGAGGRGGEWYVEPGSTAWTAWTRALKDPRDTLRFRFPRMGTGAICRELLTKPGVA